MKYLKLFEADGLGFGGYSPIRRELFVNSHKTALVFTDKEIDHIVNTSRAEVKMGRAYGNESVIPTTLHLKKRLEEMTILKAEDEWYYVDLGGFFFDANPYFKCDQMEGLDALIKKAVDYHDFRRNAIRNMPERYRRR